MPKKVTPARLRPLAAFALAAAVVLGFGACRRAAAPAVVRPVVQRKAVIEDLDYLRPQPVGAAIDGHPWIAHVATADLDGDGLIDIFACDAQKDQVVWLRQVARGRFEETPIGTGLTAPVRAEAIDMDGDGDLDVVVACMGQVFPNNDKIGSLVILENDGRGGFIKHLIFDHITRANDAQAADFNGDGRLDLTLAQFGYDQGEVTWLERTGPWEFKSHVLLDLSGAINVCVADYNGDGKPDIAALISQQWEEIYLFTNDGAGNFTRKVVYGSTNEDYGSSNLIVSDLNRDGRPDLVYTNGDGFALSEPGPRPWHGVQWFENVGNGFFYFHRIGDLPGAYGPSATDIDGDGDIDLVVVSCFADWRDPKAIPFMLYLNDGRQNFTAHVLAYKPTHLLMTSVADLDGNGRPAIVTGGFHAYAPYGSMSRITVWRRTAP